MDILKVCSIQPMQLFVLMALLYLWMATSLVHPHMDLVSLCIQACKTSVDQTKLYVLFNLNHILQAKSPNTVTLEIMVLTYEFGEDTF